MTTKVAFVSNKISSTQNISRTVSTALDLLDYKFKNNIESIAIKPNLCYYWDYSTGETTDPRVVSAIIDYLRERIDNEVNILITEADASAMKTKYAFRMLGYNKLAKKKKVRLVNLSDNPITNKEVKIQKETFSLPMNETLLEADLVINVPKLKHHRATGITCALKNIFGAIAKPRKYSYHKKLAEYIVCANKIIKSNIIIVDGVIALGKHPKNMGVLITSNDVLAVDFEMAKILGYNPENIHYLKLAKKEDIGKVTDVDILEYNVTMKEIQELFPKRNYIIQKISWGLQIKLLKLYSRIVGDTIPPILEE